MNVMNIKNSILNQVEDNAEKLAQALANVRDNFLDNRDFCASVIWTIVSGYKRFGNLRISEKQANVIAKFIETVPVESLLNNLSREDAEVLGLIEEPNTEETEEVKETEENVTVNTVLLKKNIKRATARRKFVEYVIQYDGEEDGVDYGSSLEDTISKALAAAKTGARVCIQCWDADSNLINCWNLEDYISPIQGAAYKETEDTTETINYVDLGLKSKTLWADKNSVKVDEGVNLPTCEQFQELLEECEWGREGAGYRVTGPNGRSILLEATEESTGNYWSSTPTQIKNERFALSFYQEKYGVERIGLYGANRECDFAVRSVR